MNRRIKKPRISPLHPSSFIPHPLPRSGFTLIEVLTTLAVITIIMGLMVSLSRYVRDQSAQQLTRRVLSRMDDLMQQYAQRHDGRLPPVSPLLNPKSSAVPDPSLLAVAALRNNQQCVRYLDLDFHAQHKDAQPGDSPFKDLPLSVWDDKAQTLRDAWGSPVVFMFGKHDLIGQAPSRFGQDQFFFFSAGPDRIYLTRDDNVYSYETQKVDE